MDLGTDILTSVVSGNKSIQLKNWKYTLFSDCYPTLVSYLYIYLLAVGSGIAHVINKIENKISVFVKQN